MGSQRFISCSICASTPFERHRSFTNLSKRAAGSQTLWHLSSTDAPLYAYQRAIFSHFASDPAKLGKKLLNRLAVSSFFQRFRRNSRRQSPISQLNCQTSQLIFDRSNASHEVPPCKLVDLRTIDRLGVRGQNGGVSRQRKRRKECENALRFPSLAFWGWTGNPFYSRSTLVSPRVVVFISVAYTFWES